MSGSGPGPQAAALGELSRRGVRGGVIPLHRSMIGLRATPGRLFQALAWPLAACAAVWSGLPAVTWIWARLLEGAAFRLELPGSVGLQAVEWGGRVWLGLPYLAVDAAWPEPLTRIATFAACAALVVATMFLPASWLPVAYLVRALAAVEASALVYFAASSGPFPYTVGGYLLSLAGAGAATMCLVPVLLGFTFYFLDVPAWRKLLLTAAAVGHLALWVPLQMALHACLIHRLTYLAMPPLFFFFGLLADVFFVVAIYGWGMSWQRSGRQGG